MKKVWKWIGFTIAALLIVLLLRGFLFIPYVIPSSGMENALYEGDRIIVNKWSYGLRIPYMRVFSYHRWATAAVNPGDVVVFNDPASSEPVIDKRQVFIGRCVGLPGDTLVLDSLFNAMSHWELAGPDRKRLYSYPAEMDNQMDSLLNLLALNDNRLMGENQYDRVRSFSRYEYYLIEQALGEQIWITPLQADDATRTHTRITVPRRGQTVDITPDNRTLYMNTILLHENRQATILNDTLFVDNMPMESYTFTQNYHWMTSNNFVNMADSRLFGFVPESHLIGKAAFVWFSEDPRLCFPESIRWNRIFKGIR